MHAWLFRRVLALWENKARAFRWEMWLGMLPLLFLAARGSVGTFPLTPNRIPSQGALVLDHAVVNGPMALAVAYAEWRRSNKLPAVSRGELEAAWRTLEGTPLPKDPLAAMMRRFGVLSEAPKPHIVVLQMESMGAAVWDLERAGVDLLGRLRAHLHEMFVFPRAVSAGLGTHITLERITTGAWLKHISRGPYRRNALFGAYPEALARAGWHTLFLTGGVLHWSHFDEFLPAQGFQELVGMRRIQEAIPEAQADGTWGVFDEYLFRYLQQRLLTARRPLFVYAMTITNHSPYHLPAHATPQRITPPEAWVDRFIRPEEAPKALAAYRYAADQAG
ncbi:MAG: hypothetical protein D6771_02850, partial [Zetaproteobacteria bacterium]